MHTESELGHLTQNTSKFEHCTQKYTNVHEHSTPIKKCTLCKNQNFSIRRSKKYRQLYTSKMNCSLFCFLCCFNSFQEQLNVGCTADCTFWSDLLLKNFSTIHIFCRFVITENQKKSLKDQHLQLQDQTKNDEKTRDKRKKITSWSC